MAITLQDRTKAKRILATTRKIDNQLRAEAARARMDPEAIIENIQDIIDSSMSADDFTLIRLKFQVDCYMGLLKKCMPDMRSIEITADVNNNVIGSFDINFVKSKQ